MRSLIIVICLFFSFLYGDEHSKPKTICLNMIVKDESPVITRCLKSVKPFIDYWVIVDTGSKDGTQKIIKEFMSDIPGELHEQGWVNFGHNRNEALKLAKGKGDYVLFIDADEQLEGSLDKKLLNKSIYLCWVRISKDPSVTFQRGLMIDNHLDWSWHGVLHESLSCREKPSSDLLQNVVLSAEASDGHRSQDPQKHLKDAQTLEKALLDEPDNAEYVYYLAQSYFNAKDLPQSLKNYKKRAAMDGWDQHTFWAKYFTGYLEELLDKDPKDFIKSFSEAYRFRPTRAEPIFRLAEYFFNEQEYILGYLLAQYGLSIPVPNDIVYVENWIYSYSMLGVFADCAAKLGRNEEALKAYEKIINNSDVPQSVRDQAKSIWRAIEEKRLGLKNLSQ